ncbi:chemotaxis protein CheB [Sphingobacterium oryzagri]|uniref:protein-glutamate methylesterase n=1 Tax=Sphingobacterium oryzagri TaxID=3025669 RepID=A0ABY7WMI5_9SPHI|nr:chemotaxis protein CheB [Sphingobacterium sp. KACC 22765]WDF70715.1 chemotaxis protein CheB [Sphingobacterium sp. KACC 22765]
MENKDINHIIVIGASAGGLSAVESLLSSVPATIDAALFIVIHLSKNARQDNILSILKRQSNWPLQIPKNGTIVTRGVAYLAPIDCHMMLSDGHIMVSGGAMENHYRPSIDVLFRTAAATYSSCVIGIILSGLLDDGVSGMSAIKSAGGVCIVQDPDEADYAEMAVNVLKQTDVDYQVPLSDIAYILADISSRGDCDPAAIPDQLRKEADITIRRATNYADTDKLGSPTMFTCPDCGGMLTKIEGETTARYRCYTGHVFSEQFLEEQYLLKTEETLWVAMRMMEERRNFLGSLERKFGTQGPTAKERKERVIELEKHITHLKVMLANFGTPISLRGNSD